MCVGGGCQWLIERSDGRFGPTDIFPIMPAQRSSVELSTMQLPTKCAGYSVRNFAADLIKKPFGVPHGGGGFLRLNWWCVSRSEDAAKLGYKPLRCFLRANLDRR